MQAIGPDSVNAVYALPGRPFRGLMHQSGDPGGFRLRTGRRPGPREPIPLCLAATEEAALLLGAGRIESDEEITVRRHMRTFQVELTVLDLLNPLAQQACAIEPHVLRDADPGVIRQLMGVVRKRKDVEGLLLECPAWLGMMPPVLAMLVVMPDAIANGALKLRGSWIAEFELMPPPVPEPSS